MRFKDYCLYNEAELESNFALSYYPQTQQWGPAQWGNKGSIVVMGRKPSEHNQKKYIDIEGVARHSPQLKKMLAKLLEQFPELVDYPVKFDGPSNETLKQVVDRVSQKEFDGVPGTWFHGTSTWHWKQMGNQGIRPRGLTGVDPSYQMGAAPSNPQYVYLMDNDGNAVRFAAREANSKAIAAGHRDSRPIVLKIDGRRLHRGDFRPDEDSNENRWEQSLWTMGAVAYEGEIPTESVQPHLILDKDKNAWIPLEQ